MNLFRPSPKHNLLPCDGEVFYFGRVFSKEESDAVFHELATQVPWEYDRVVLFGKTIVTHRKVAWFATNTAPYSYSGTTKYPQTWTPLLQVLKQRIENITGATFNSCLLNCYPSGAEGMSWHSDDESSLVSQSAIASVSFGSERKFCFKHKRHACSQAVYLEHGSLLLMKGVTQSHWLHSLPKSKRIQSPRINLTFRTMR